MSSYAYDRLVPSVGVYDFDRLLDTTGVPQITSVGTVTDGAAMTITGTGFSASGNSVTVLQGASVQQIVVASEGTTSITTGVLGTTGLYLTQPIAITVTNNSGVTSIPVTASIVPKTGESVFAINQEFLGDASTRAEGAPDLLPTDEVRIKNPVGDTIAGITMTGQGAFVVTSGITAFDYGIFDGTLLGAYATATWANPSSTASVPNVINLTQAAALSAIAAVGLIGSVVANVQSATIPAGSVAGQFPAAGQALTIGGVVEISISTGNNTVLVPIFLGESESVATMQRTQLGLVGFTYHLVDGLNTGLVLNQSVTPGTPVAVGSAVDIVVSSNLAPDLVGLLVQDAEALINASNLSFDQTTFLSNYDTTYPVQTVLAQSPAAESVVAPGAQIILTLSLGPQPQRQGIVSPGIKRRSARRFRTD